jgi:hypothetical protein
MLPAQPAVRNERRKIDRIKRMPFLKGIPKYNRDEGIFSH